MFSLPLRPHEAEDSVSQQVVAEELIGSGDLEAARQVLERLLEENPGDGRSRGLLGLCHFKLGQLRLAAEIYGALVADNPTDATLRVNLGLVSLKDGRLDQAIESLEAAVSLAPGHRKALNYLGLALAQRGDPKAARDAFLQAGASAMAEKMEKILEEEQQAAAREVDRLAKAFASGAPLPRDPPPVVEEDVDVDAAFSIYEDEEPPAPAVPIAPAAPIPPVTQAEAPKAKSGAEVFHFHGSRRPQPRHSVPTIDDLARSAPLEWPAGSPYGVGQGAVAIEFPAEIHTRLDGLVAARGDTAWMPVFKRFRGKNTERTFGTGPRQMWRASGAGHLLFSTAGGSGNRTFLPMRIESEAYLVEDRVFSFEDSFDFENGRLPGQARDLHLVRLQGAGQVLLVSERPIRAERLSGEDCLSLPVSALIGWTGALAPRLVSAEEGPAIPWIELVGEGIVLLLD